LKAERGRGLLEMLKITKNLFGKIDNIISHKDSILVGVTNCPLGSRLEVIKVLVL
jgi:hypothetical protein